MQHFESFKNYYANNLEQIMTAMPGVWGGSGGIYAFDWPSLFTPIEMQIWYSIRDAGIVMYPQFPIDKYFADFANPLIKVVVECDGAEWHSREKDSARDKRMAHLGWRVYRIPGRKCFGTLELSDDERADAHAIDEWSRTGDALIKALAHRYFGRAASERMSRAYSTALSHFASKDGFI